MRGLVDWAYAHDDHCLRQSAVFAMGRSVDLFWADTILAELCSGSPAMRYEAVRACGELQLERAVGGLIQLAQDPDREVQSMAIWALGQIGGSRARSALQGWAASDDEAVVLAASEALDEIELVSGATDLFVHDVEDSRDAEGMGVVETDTMAHDGEGDADAADRDNDEWEDDFLYPD